MTRRLCIAAVAALIAALVAGCGSDAPGDAGATTGPWSYTSGNGQVVTLERRPERIIAHAYSAAARAKPGLTALAISPYDGKYAVAVPKHAPSCATSRPGAST